MKVTIVDYGMGNIKSIIGALKYLGVRKITVSSTLADISSADRLILPGVGSFSVAMSNIKNLNIDKYLIRVVLEEEKPILGICLGMQLMCTSSTEGGSTQGIGFINGAVERFKDADFKVPHIGFNQVNFSEDSRLFAGINNLSDFYFVHSFKLTSDININQSTCNYNGKFISSYEVGNINGVQFHPELSQTHGLKLLGNFLDNFNA
jgi:glutamine amidotransferase